MKPVGGTEYSIKRQSRLTGNINMEIEPGVVITSRKLSNR